MCCICLKLDVHVVVAALPRNPWYRPLNFSLVQTKYASEIAAIHCLILRA